jgi:hypothetical protein
LAARAARGGRETVAIVSWTLRNLTVVFVMTGQRRRTKHSAGPATRTIGECIERAWFGKSHWTKADVAGAQTQS